MGGARSAPMSRLVGQEFGAPYDSGFVESSCSNGLTCSHTTEANEFNGSLLAETSARPNPGSLAGSGSAGAVSLVNASAWTTDDVPALRLTVDLRVLKGSRVVIERPTSEAIVAVAVSAGRVGCADCRAFLHVPVLSSSALDDKPSVLEEDRALSLTVDVRSKDGKPMRPGAYYLSAMAQSYVGSTRTPTIGTVEAKASVVVDKMKTEVLPA